MSYLICLIRKNLKIYNLFSFFKKKLNSKKKLINFNYNILQLDKKNLVCSVILASTFFYNFVNSFYFKTRYLGLDASMERFVNHNRVDYNIFFWLTIFVALFTVRNSLILIVFFLLLQ